MNVRFSYVLSAHMISAPIESRSRSFLSTSTMALITELLVRSNRSFDHWEGSTIWSHKVVIIGRLALKNRSFDHSHKVLIIEWLVRSNRSFDHWEGSTIWSHEVRLLDGLYGPIAVSILRRKYDLLTQGSDYWTAGLLVQANRIFYHSERSTIWSHKQSQKQVKIHARQQQKPKLQET